MKALFIAVNFLFIILQCPGQSSVNRIVPLIPERISIRNNFSSISDLAMRPGKLSKSMVPNGKTREASLFKNVLQKMDSLIIEEISEETGQLSHSVKDEFFFSNQGLLSSYIESEWMPVPGNWIKSYEDKYTYDDQGNCLNDIFSNWNAATSEWELNAKWEFTYTSQHQLASEMGYMWDPGSSEWIIDYKDEYSYLPNEMVSARSIWNPSLNEWEIMFKMKYLFNDAGNLIQSTSFFWDVITEQWLNLNQIDHYYTPEQKPETIISRFWDMENEEWLDSNKEAFLYGPGGDMLIHTYYEWDSFSGLWTETGKEENSYNQQYIFEDLLIPELFEHNEFYFNHMLTQLSAYGFSGLSYSFAGSMKFYYSEIILTGIVEPEKLIMAIFPNPVSETITISWPGNTSAATFEIIDCVGQRVYSEIIRKSTPIPISGFPDGMYICRVTDNQCIYSEKIIIKKQ